ncbi:hypothetical protein RJ640_000007 [Escallonia rubra]|uniref:Protein kinase domain-containing protein n=1 Tax=Escallonia rubra TaxID=112253 RepID=A0AA88UN54_9ASTE|nr:hypothetical protein RJ640_000007 [Escallonia rubra]
MRWTREVGEDGCQKLTSWWPPMMIADADASPRWVHDAMLTVFFQSLQWCRSGAKMVAVALQRRPTKQILVERRDASFNQISGNIPSTNGGLQNLVEFSLAHKRSEGLIPDTLESLTSLEILDLSHNNPSATNGFSESNLVGSGSFGSVYRGVLSDGIVVAIKVFRLNQEKALKSFETECEVIHNIRHRNLTKVITSCSNLDFRVVVLEYMPNGSLEKWLYSYNYYLGIMQRLNIMIDVACALDYLHFGFETPVVHCDLKPSKVLLNEDMIGHVDLTLPEAKY